MNNNFGSNNIINWVELVLLILIIILIIVKLWGGVAITYELKDDDVKIIEEYRQIFVSQLTAELAVDMNIPADQISEENLLISLSPEDTTIYTLLFDKYEVDAEINWHKKKIYLSYRAEIRPGMTYRKEIRLKFKENQIDFLKLEYFITDCKNDVYKLQNELSYGSK